MEYVSFNLVEVNILWVLTALEHMIQQPVTRVLPPFKWTKEHKITFHSNWCVVGVEETGGQTILKSACYLGYVLRISSSQS